MIGVLSEIALFIVLYFVFKWRPTQKCVAFLSYDNTDFLKGLAILMIVIMHSCANMHNADGFSSLGGIGVSLFLILSAYGLSESFKKSGLEGFVKKKIIRILAPYAMFLVMVTCLQGKWASFCTIQFYLDLFCIKTSYWFISFLVYNYILFWIAKRIDKQWLSYALFLIFGVVVFCFDDRIRAEQVLSFPMGLLLSDHKERIKFYIERRSTFLLSIVIGVLAISGVMFVGTKIISSSSLILTHTLLLYKFCVALCILFIFNILPPLYRNSQNFQLQYL